MPSFLIIQDHYPCLSPLESAFRWGGGLVTSF